MSVKITTLVENKKGEHLGLRNEHGLSFYIEKDGISYIFDTGESDAFISNAFKLGINPFDVDKIILSHGHYDHSGGVRYFFNKKEAVQNVEFVLHENFFDLKYAINGAQTEFLGNNFTEADIIKNNCTTNTISQDMERIGDGVYVISNFIRNSSEEIIKPRFKLLKDNELIPDNFNDEIMLAVESSKGWILIVGCAHPGIMNMIHTFQERLAGQLYAVLGGTHLVEANESCLVSTTKFFNDLSCDIIGVSHCTGSIAEDHLATNPRFFHNSTGSCIIVK